MAKSWNNILWLWLLLLTGCSPRLHPQCSYEVKRDTVIRERVVEDTVFYEVPIIKEVNVTKDSISHLENRYAESSAEIKDGLLHHTLSTKEQRLAIPYITTVAETTVSTNEIRYVVREVERRLSVWESFQIMLGRILIIIIIAGIVYYAVFKIRR